MKQICFTYLLVPVIAMLAGGCTISDTQPPPLSGPSEMSLSLALSANPDVLSQDGGSQSVITIDARDINGQPVANTLLRLEIEGGDFGSLSARSVVTNSTGRASFTYTAPPESLTNGSQEPSDVRIRVIPSGTDASASVARLVTIHLIPQGTIKTGAPTPQFTFVPSNPTAFQLVRFDASTSTAPRGATITEYLWDFGDGSTSSEADANTTHTYVLAGPYSVRLTVTANGVSATTAQLVNVGSGTPPSAVFVFSPTAPEALQNVFFNASQSTAAAGRRIVSYRWNFGDGSTGSGVTRSHSYTLPATYVVVLTVTDDVGQTATMSSSVTVCPVGGCEEEEEEE